jgi:C1A family cysteine protease
MIYQFVVALSIAAAASASLYSEDKASQKSLWEAFKVEHGKKYDTMEEETRRFYTFVENLKVADQRNAEEKKAGGEAIHGITKFSDLSQVEFETGLLTSDPSMRKADSERNFDTTVYEPVKTTGLVNWSGKYTTAVKDQGYCGSCWAFSATEQIESDSMRTLGDNFILSPEQITQCDSTSQGCNGGWTEHAYDYVKKAGGIETNADYPYTSYQGTTGTCKADKNKFKVTVSKYTTINGESAMTSYMQSTGPLSVCLDASSWNSYKGGVMTSCGQRVDHCVQAVGVDTTASTPYWLVRNSWGTSWGESGYIRLKWNANTCNIKSDPTWVTVANK